MGIPVNQAVEWDWIGLADEYQASQSLQGPYLEDEYLPPFPELHETNTTRAHVKRF